MKLSAADLAKATGGQWQAVPPAEIHGFHFDTRKLVSGSCFIALTHGNRDGHDFIGQAAVKGATCAIVERICSVNLPQLLVTDSLEAIAAIAAAERQSFKKPVIGITGSCGKTSTKSMLHVLLGANRTYVTPGNWNNRVGVPMTLFGLSDQDVDFAVIEAGISEPKEMELLAEMIAPDLVIVTQLGASHLEGLHSMEGIAFEKSRLMNAAQANASLVLPASVYAYPDFHAFASQACVVLENDALLPPSVPKPAKTVRYSFTKKGIKMYGIEFNLASTSKGMRSNAALAITAAQLLGSDLVDGSEGLSRWRAQPFRGESFFVGEEFFYIDCYNANPSSMRDALHTFLNDAPQDLPRAYIIGVMNELGNSARDYHFEIGKELALRAEDKVWFIGPDDLTEAYAAGASDSSVAKVQISCTSQPKEIESEIRKFSGAYFLKGSRQFKLESLLSKSLNPHY